jgi:hypothetical protein
MHRKRLMMHAFILVTKGVAHRRSIREFDFLSI